MNRLAAPGVQRQLPQLLRGLREHVFQFHRHVQFVFAFQELRGQPSAQRGFHQRAHVGLGQSHFGQPFAIGDNLQLRCAGDEIRAHGAHARQPPQLLRRLPLQFAQPVEIVGDEVHLELLAGIAEDGGAGRHHKAITGEVVTLRPQPLDHRIQAGGSGEFRFEHAQHPAHAAGPIHQPGAFDFRLGANELLERFSLADRFGQAGPRQRFGPPDHQIAVAVGQEIGGRQQREADADQHDRNRQHQQATQDAARPQRPRHRRGQPVFQPALHPAKYGGGSGHGAVQPVAAHAVARRLNLAGFVRAEKQAGQHRHQRQRREQREQRRRRQGNRHVGVQLADFARHQQQGDEHHHVGQGRAEQRRPHLDGSLDSGANRTLAALQMGEHVLDDHDGAVHDHPDRERQPGQADDVQAAPQQRHDAEHADQRHRNRHHDDGHGAQRPQEQHQRQRRQRRAGQQVAPHQLHRLADVFALVVVVNEVNAFAGAVELLLQFGDGRPHALGHFRHVGADLPDHADSDGRLIPEHHDAVQWLAAEFDAGHIAQIHRAPCVAPQHELLQLRQILRPADGAHPVFAPSQRHGAAAHVAIVVAQHLHHVADGQIAHRQRLGIDPHLDLALLPAGREELPDARHPPQAGQDHVVHQIAVMVRIALKPRFRRQHDPHHRRTRPADHLHVRFARFRRQVVHLLQLVEHVHHPLAQPAAVHELQGHAAAAGAGGAADFPHAQHFFHSFFNRAGHQIFDLDRTGAGIAGGDGDFRAVAAGLQFQRQAAQGDPAEDRQQAEQNEGAMPPADGGRDPAHGAFPTIFTIAPSRRPSPPRTTMSWPGRKASL